MKKKISIIFFIILIFFLFACSIIDEYQKTHSDSQISDMSETESISLGNQIDNAIQESAESPIENAEENSSVELKRAGEEKVNELDGAILIYVPAGSVYMGDIHADLDEMPPHRVNLDAFWVYKYEVTNSQYANFLNSNGNQSESGVLWFNIDSNDKQISNINGAWNPDKNFGDHPVANVTWYGAQAYCEWAGGHLPSEAQWEKAARGNSSNPYPWGVEEPNSNLRSDDFNSTDPVGSYPDGASPLGVMDMCCNVSEWALDWYDDDYYTISPSENPTGPNTGTQKALRGGKTYGRGGRDPIFTDVRVGFRCVQNVSSSNDSENIIVLDPTDVIDKTTENDHFVQIPSGKFLMGSTEEDIRFVLEFFTNGGDAHPFSNELPQHEIYLDDYWISKFEITNKQYVEFLNDVGNQKEEEEFWFNVNSNSDSVHIFENDGIWYVEEGYENFPIVEVNWFGAKSYCEWIGGRLPTEAEWEKAARGTDGRMFPWGNIEIDKKLLEDGEDLYFIYLQKVYDIRNYANLCDHDCYAPTFVLADENKPAVPVGSFPDGVSPFGVWDMAGNVSEWVADWYDANYYELSPYSNPPGPEIPVVSIGDRGESRVIRGGSWVDLEPKLRVTDRSYNLPIDSNDYTGFRCVLDQMP